DVKDLEDPKNAMGDPEKMHFLGTEGFSDEFAEASDLIKGIKLDDKTYGELEDLIVNEYEEGQEGDAVDQWIKDNPKAFDSEITPCAPVRPRGRRTRLCGSGGRAGLSPCIEQIHQRAADRAVLRRGSIRGRGPGADDLAG